MPVGRFSTLLTLVKSVHLGMIVLIAVAGGVWGSALLVRDFQLAGPVARQIPSVLIITGALVAGIFLLPASIYLVYRRISRRTTEPNRSGRRVHNAMDEWFSAPRLWFTGGMALAIMPVAILLAAAALHLSIGLCAALGLPGRLSGVWPTIITLLVIQTIGTFLATVLGSSAGWRQTREAIGELVRYSFFLGGLLLSIWLFDGVRVEAAPGWKQLFLLAVLAVLFADLDLEVAVPGLTIVLTLTINALALWAMSWLSTWMDVTLQISGFWTFLLVSLIMSVLAALFRPASGGPGPDPFITDIDPFPYMPH